MLSDQSTGHSYAPAVTRLNAPYDAPRFPTVTLRAVRFAHSQTCLNTPHDAPRFPTSCLTWNRGRHQESLNAPHGAPRFLTDPHHARCGCGVLRVLMHLMALRAF